MSHEVEVGRGVKNYSTWHGLFEIEQLRDADHQIDKGEELGCYPIELDILDGVNVDGIPLDPSRAVVATYRNHPRRGWVVGDRYHATTPQRWRDAIQAAGAAGAKPTGAFSLRGGAIVVATFSIKANGLHQNFFLADSFNGSLRFTAGDSTIDPVCWNTLSMAIRQDGDGMARFRHTSSLDSKVAALTSVIGDSLKRGQKVATLVAQAQTTRLDREQAKAAFDALFPEAPEGASKAAQTKAENARHDARVAAALPINRRNAQPGTLATLWNAATYLVDRRTDGTSRDLRGGADALDSMLFGARAKRVQEIQNVIEVVMRDGTIQPMTVAQAVDAGAVDGKALLESMM